MDSYVEECIRNCMAIDYWPFEILLLPDSPSELKGAKVIATGPVRPAAKRNVGMKNATGEFYAFIDSDAYPRRDWLKTALPYFNDPDVAGVGGPSITPVEDTTMQKGSGAVYSSLMGSFKFALRYSSKQLQYTDDLPTCNLIVRESVFKESGGFDERFLTGEDTKACMDIVYRQGKKLVYAPDLIVYHHRRPLFRPHLKQVWTYARHRGMFARIFPKTSRRITYFVPSVIVTGLVAGLLLSFIPIVRLFVTIVCGIYLAAAVLAGLATKNPKLFLVLPLGIFLTHLTYGMGFLSGLVSETVD
jgi:cellulose synthase/poly-beta-1,6-N-acetylglucosamine synthase-like glycosyltransferase